MSEEETKKPEGEESVEEEKVEDSPSEETHDSIDRIEEANKAAARIEAANKKQEELVKRLEKIAVDNALGGRGIAGDRAKKEETPQDYKNRVMGGNI